MIKDKKKIFEAVVDKVEKVSRSAYLIETDLKEEVDVKAGQFVSIYCDGLTLRRPFSVYSCKASKIGILFKEKGKGTKYIKSLKKGDLVNITGPFGNGFTLENKKALSVGAGIGYAPVAFLKSKSDECGIENMLLCGFPNKNEIPDLVKADVICTDDGSYGIKGSVLDAAENILKDYKPQIIYACGPLIVLKKLVQTAQKYDIPVQVAMEKEMACSIGVCRGCVIRVKHDGNIVNKTVCKDGPVFWGSEVVW